MAYRDFWFGVLLLSSLAIASSACGGSAFEPIDFEAGDGDPHDATVDGSKTDGSTSGVGIDANAHDAGIDANPRDAGTDANAHDAQGICTGFLDDCDTTSKCCGSLECLVMASLNKEVCCVVSGDSCEASTDCCGTTSCVGGVCNCRFTGGACRQSQDCCSRHCVDAGCL